MINNLSKIVFKFNPNIVIHSGLPRSQQTAEMLKLPKNCTLIMNALLAEQKTGIGADDEMPDGFVTMSERLGDGGESYQEMYDRVRGAWNWISSTFDTSKDERIVIITHERFMTFFVNYIMGINPNGFNMEIPHTGYIIFNIEDDKRPKLVVPVPDDDYL